MKTILFLSATFFLMIGMSSCKKSDSGFVDPNENQNPPPPPVDPPPAAEELLFQTGFENGVSMVSTGPQYAEFRGADATLPNSNDWVNDLVNDPNVGIFRVYYEQGDSSQRLASIVPDPVSASNKVLNFKIVEPHIDVAPSSHYTVNGILFDQKARVQTEMYGNTGIKEIYQSIRLFLPSDFNKLVNSTYPAGGDWLNLFEFWNNNVWSAGLSYRFRFGINIEKGSSTVGSPLYFKTEGQTNANNTFTRAWIHKNTSFPVPINRWMTIDYYIKEGNNGNGRFYFAVTPDGGTKTVVFDVAEATCHPNDPNPDGIAELNPIKLYTSNNLVNQMNALGGTLQVYWDDFKLWKNKRP